MLKEEIRNAFNQARKSGSSVEKSALEAVLAAILLKEKSGSGEVGDNEVLDCITKEIKVQKEIKEMFLTKHPEKSEEASQKAEILAKFLPQQLSEAEVSAIIAEVAPQGDKSPKAKGLIMKALMPRINGRFDKAKVNALVDAFLNS